MNITDRKIKTELSVAESYLKDIKTEGMDYESEKKLIKGITLLECLINLIDWMILMDNFKSGSLVVEGKFKEPDKVEEI